MANRTDPVTPLAAHRQAIARHCRADEAAAVAAQPSVQQPAEMLEGIANGLPAMRQLSEQLYSVWIKGLAGRNA